MSATTHSVLTRIQPRSHASTGAGVAVQLGRLLGTWRKRVRDRQAFGQLEYRDLRDMGLSQWEVEAELAKPFWRE